MATMNAEGPRAIALQAPKDCPLLQVDKEYDRPELRSWQGQSWRDGIKIHPAADLFPMMGEAELDELSADIAKNGLQKPVEWFRDQLIDGRNRVAAIARIADEARREQLTKELVE